MTDFADQEPLILKFEGRLADENRLPARVLTQTLEAMQRAVYLLAMEQEEVETRRRERLSRDLEMRYALICTPPKPGSYVVEARIGDPTSDFFVPESSRSVAEKFREASRIFTENVGGLSSLVRDRSRRLRLFEAFRQMLPREGSGIRLSIRQGMAAEPFFNSQSVDRSELAASIVESSEEEPMAVTGRLAKIDFNAREFTLEYPANGRLLKCHYEDAVEDLLLENPRGLIQVIGTVIRDDADLPLEIRDVEDIREVDLAPFFIREFQWEGQTLKPAKAVELVLQPDLDESKQLLRIVDERLGLDAHAYTREELDDEINAQTIFLWNSYAKGDPGQMTERARTLRERLLALLTEEVSIRAEG